MPVLVVGGGIGGLAAALALARAGREVRLLEQSPRFGEVGAGIQLAPNATRALAALGVLERVEQHAVRPRRLLMMDAVDGEPLTELDLGDTFRAHYGAPYLVLHRHDLHSELLAACREHDRIDLQTGRRMTTWRRTRRGAIVECADGSLHECDAVVGADGLHSTIRAALSPDPLIASRFVAYRGPIPLDRAGDRVQMDTVVAWIGPGLHLVQYPIRRGELYNQVAVFRSDRYTPDGDDWGTPEELVERFSRTCGAVRSAVGLLDHGMRWTMADREPIGSWTDGPVTLLGDAAHPMLQYLAQGGCQALEDAVQLGMDLVPGRDAHEAFRAYEAERIPRTERVQRSARSWGELWHLDGVARQVRNRLLRVRAPADFSETDWLYAGGPIAAPEREAA